MKPSYSGIISDYLNEVDPSNRLKLLVNFRSDGSTLPLNLAWDLMELGLPVTEQVEIVSAAHHVDPLYLEDFFTQLTPFVHQDVAIRAFREWYLKTPRRMWYRWLKVVFFPDLPQRLRYTMLDLADLTLSRQLLRCYSKVSSLADFSEAFLSLLINKALHCDYDHKFYIELSFKVLKEGISGDINRQSQRLFLSAYHYLKIHDSSRITSLPVNLNLPAYLSPLAAPSQHDRRKEAHERWKQFKTFKESEQTVEKLKHYWPDVIERGFVVEGDLVIALKAYFRCGGSEKDLNEGRLFFEELFARLRDDLIMRAVCALENGLEFATATQYTERLVPYPAHKLLISGTIRRFRVTESPDIFMKSLSRSLRYAIEKAHRPEEETLELAAVMREETFVLQKISLKEPLHTLLSEPFEAIFYPYQESKAFEKQEIKDIERFCFFSESYRQSAKISDSSETIENSKSSSFWNVIRKSWNAPGDIDLEAAAKLARTQPHLFQIVFVRFLGRLRNSEEAFLKLLDYVRSTDLGILREVAESLGMIGSSRSSQELTAMLTRPNVDDGLRIEIIRILKSLDTSLVQAELRSSLLDLRSQSDGTEGRVEVIDALAALVTNPTQSPELLLKQDSKKNVKNENEPELDRELELKIEGYSDLSSEARRALRSAEFFYSEASRSSQLGLMDLSPVLDMQFKALELTFRERFENICQQLVQAGVLQRKLDQLGYARPIESKMADFEKFLSSLEVVKEIPFFSRFKLRKMLRAICQYRPGKRFTLDGLKAFGLFFLAFGRIDCPYGLGKILPMPFENDRDLARFCHLLHVFQDMRNRAAHEGFRPDAAGDLSAVWAHTSAIIAESSKVLDGFNKGKMSLIWSNLDVGVRGFEKAKDVQIVHKSVS